MEVFIVTKSLCDEIKGCVGDDVKGYLQMQ